MKDFVYSLPGYIEPADAQDPIQQLLKASPQELEAMDAKLPEVLRTFAQTIARMSTVEHETLVGGDQVGQAAVDLLYGRVNPSGHLAETWPLQVEDNPSWLNFPGEDGVVEYREGI